MNGSPHNADYVVRRARSFSRTVVSGEQGEKEVAVTGKGSKIAIVVGVLVVLGGAIGFLRPFVIRHISAQKLMDTVEGYQAAAKALDAGTKSGMLSAAEEYNREVADRGSLLVALNDGEKAAYDALLQVSGTGVLGYIEIPKIDVTLPIFHGTGEDVLQVGIGHVEGTSFPIGGESVHTVLSGHSGLPSARLFTDIDQLAAGDTFTVTVLDRTSTYEVDGVDTVLPEKADKLRLIPGEDRCTLITCTPSGVNSHRLIVRAHRTQTAAAGYAGTPGTDLTLYIILAVLILLAFILTAAIAANVRRGRTSHRHRRR